MDLIRIPRALRATVIALCVVIPALSAAEEPSSSSIGFTAPVESDVVREDREFRLRGFPGQNLEKSTIVDAEYRALHATHVRKRTESRRACRDDMRRANKTTLVQTILRCYSSELTSLKDVLQKEKESLVAMAGLTPLVRSPAVKTADRMIDAVATLLFAIDSGVYGTKEEVLEAKRNLYQKYAVPLWSSWVTVRADRALTWVASLIAQIDALHAEEVANGTDRSEWSDARGCFVSQENTLRPLLKPETPNRSEKLVPALAILQECVRKLQAIPRLMTESGSTASSSSAH